MLVTTATVGESFRNDPSLSSASATRKSPDPSFALEPRLLSFPPTTAGGAHPPVARAVGARGPPPALPPRGEKPLRGVREPKVRSGDAVAEVQEELGNPAHPEPADPDEVVADSIPIHPRPPPSPPAL